MAYPRLKTLAHQASYAPDAATASRHTGLLSTAHLHATAAPVILSWRTLGAWSRRVSRGPIYPGTLGGHYKSFGVYHWKTSGDAKHPLKRLTCKDSLWSKLSFGFRQCSIESPQGCARNPRRSSTTCSSELSDCITSRRFALTCSTCLTGYMLTMASCQAEEASVGGGGQVSKLEYAMETQSASESTGASTGTRTLTINNGGKMYDVMHQQSGYPALIYLPPKVASGSFATQQKLPLLVVLHGAGKNVLDVWNLANPRGEHAGLAPSLLAGDRAPSELAENFIVAAPYSYQKQSFYEDSRSQLLSFIRWLQEDGSAAGISHLVDPQRVILFGFSDGATVGVELMLTRRFLGGVFAAYGFTGEFPSRALELLKDLNMWVFHSKDDVIFPVKCSDNLVASLRRVNSRTNAVRYTRYEADQEGFTGSVQGHSTGITASKLPDIYDWMLSL